MPKKQPSFLDKSFLKKRSRAFTMLEVLITLAILAGLAAIAIPVYQKAVRRSESAEAIMSMNAIRSSQQAYHAQHQTYVEADSTNAINQMLGLDIRENLFTYSILEASDNDFIIIARRLGTSLLETVGEAMLSMNAQGAVAYVDPSSSLAQAAGGGLPLGGGGFGGGGGGGSSGGGASGSGGGSGGGGSSGSSGGGGSAGSQPVVSANSGAGDTVSDYPFPSESVIAADSYDLPLSYVERGADIWEDWGDENDVNISGSFDTELLAAFNMADASGASSITDDLELKGISITVGSSEFDAGGICFGSIACHVRGAGSALDIPGPPTPPPYILFNPDYMDEETELLATVLIHEGTHFQQFLDGDSMNPNLDVIDRELRAFWNMSTYWGTVRAGFLPIDTPLEDANEDAYQAALQGEAVLRAYIDQFYD
jgi:prepilin-type N-terminal cleavage/methylation domain-containing protein